MPDELSSLPFLTRKMLSFEHATRIGLELNVTADSAATVLVRGITREGTFAFKFVAAGASGLQTTTFSLPDIPILASVMDFPNELVQGQCYVKLNLTIDGVVVYTLCEGYIYKAHVIGWPGVNKPDAMPNFGRLQVITSANPVPGVELSQGVTVGENWRIIAIRFQLVTDANVANRRVHVVFQHAGGDIVDAFGNVDQTASTTRNYTVAAFGTYLTEANDDDILIPIPANLILPSNGSIYTTTTNKQVADNFGSMDILVEKFFTT